MREPDVESRDTLVDLRAIPTQRIEPRPSARGTRVLPSLCVGAALVSAGAASHMAIEVRLEPPTEGSLEPNAAVTSSVAPIRGAASAVPPLPDSIAHHLPERRYAEAIATLAGSAPAAHVEAWRQEIRTAWLEYAVALSKASNPEILDVALDHVTALQRAWPSDAAIEKIAGELWLRHRRHLASFEARLGEMGLRAELRPTGDRHYAIQVDWNPTRALHRDVARGDTRAPERVVADLVALIGDATRGSGFRSSYVDVHLAETQGGFRFPTACARKLLRLGRREPERARRTLDQCLEKLRFDAAH